MPAPLISIITPTYNSASTLEKNILSVASQKYKEIEHIFIDNCSTDKSLQIIETYKKKFKHIRVLSEKDEGVYDAMNKGIKVAKGEYLLFLNSGDCLLNKDVLKEVFTNNKN